MTVTSRCHGGGSRRQRPQETLLTAAGSPHRGQSEWANAREVAQREQIPQRAIATGIWHSQHKLCAVSIFHLVMVEREQ
ncbi:hypothetical protein NUITMVR1_03600 [Raoultella ornithinolytica]|nr:hypothetical protein NUITMVR1_03600 [Raoultella ornithinolytica]